MKRGSGPKRGKKIAALASDTSQERKLQYHEFILELPSPSDVELMDLNLDDKKEDQDTDLVFVNLDESTGPNQDMGTRNLVRSHVMRDFQQKKYQKETSRARRNQLVSATFEGRNKEENPRGSVEEVDRNDCYESDIQQSTEGACFPSPHLLLGGTEPFDVMPIAKTPRLQQGSADNNVLLNTLVPVNPKDKWFNYAITDPALFHVTMLHAVMHHGLTHGDVGVEVEALALKSETISLVIRKLADPIEGISDLTIGVVANLVLFENQSGNVELSSVHMRGLQRMIALRGGLDVLGLAGLLRRKILWGDLLYATLAGTEPCFNLTPRTVLNSATVSDASWSGPSYPQPCTCSSQFMSLLRELHSVSNINSIKAILEGCLSDQIYLMERKLLYLFKDVQDFPHLHSSNCRAVVVPCIIAAQIYLYLTLRDFSTDMPIIATFLHRLDGLFESEGRAETWKGKHKLLIWGLTLASLVARGDQKSKYVDHLAGVCRIVGIASLDDLSAVLEVVAWRDARQDLGLVSLWNEVHRTLMLEVLDFKSGDGV